MATTNNNNFPFGNMQSGNTGFNPGGGFLGGLFGGQQQGGQAMTDQNTNWMSNWMQSLNGGQNQGWFNQWMSNAQNPQNNPFTQIQNTPQYNINSPVVTSSNQGQQIANQNQQFVNGYTVQPGNTISQIAGMMGMTVAQLLAYNPQITNPNLIYPGQVINSAQNYYQQQQGLNGTLNGTQPGPNASGGSTGPTGTGAGGVGGGNQNPSASGATPPVGQNMPNSDMGLNPTPYQAQNFDQFNNNPLVQQFDTYINTLNGLAASNNKMLQDEISSITQQYSSLRNKQTIANQSYEQAAKVLGIREGRTEFAPMVQAGINMATQSAGIEKLGDISLKENQALIEARKANNAELHAIVKDLSSLQESKINTIRGMKEDLIKQTTFQNAQQDRYLANNLPGIYTSLKSLPADQQQAQLALLAGKMGIDPQVLKSGYYNFQQEQTKGLRSAIESLMAKYPDANISQEAYLNADMNAIRKSIMSSATYRAELERTQAATAASRASASAASGGNASSLLAGLPKNIQSSIIAQMDKFKSNKTIQNYNTIRDGYLFLNQLDKTKPTSTNDQAFIYTMAKILDPNSAVKEGEYKTIQKYAQAVVDRYAKEAGRVFTNGTFLTDAARANIINTMKSRYNSAQQVYNITLKDYASGIDKISGKNGLGQNILGNDFNINDYIGGGSSTSVLDGILGQ